MNNNSNNNNNNNNNNSNIDNNNTFRPIICVPLLWKILAGVLGEGPSRILNRRLCSMGIKRFSER